MSKNDKAGPNERMILISVNGEEAVPVTGNLNAPLKTLVAKALHETGNVGRPPDDWEFKDALGNPLEMTQKIALFGFSGETVIFLGLKAGIAG